MLLSCRLRNHLPFLGRIGDRPGSKRREFRGGNSVSPLPERHGGTAEREGHVKVEAGNPRKRIRTRGEAPLDIRGGA